MHLLFIACRWLLAIFSNAVLCMASAPAATLPFANTSASSFWLVATNVGGVDGQLTSFPTTGFTTAVSETGRFSESTGWIANNSTGTNACCVGTWTFFVFRQTFDLTNFDPASANLTFRWAADDSGEGFADRGSWTPKYSLNSGAFIDGLWPTTATYELGLVNTLSTGFIDGVNTIDFYVEGNGITDGMALTGTLSADPITTVPAVPEASEWALMLTGLLCVGVWADRAQRNCPTQTAQALSEN